ncbi:MAG: peptidase [Proteobacteria bacterium]|nr:MAG: peptidase [Pseudomonadota bacterium]
MKGRELRRRAMRWLTLAHRWLGIGTCLLFAMWFASGLVMMYVPFPALTGAERLAGLEPIDWRAVRWSPDDVMRLAGLSEYPRELRLEMMAGEPVWRLRPAGAPWQVISAVDGRKIEAIEEGEALAIARAFSGSAGARLDALLERDQWTVAGTYHPHRPLYRVAIGDAAGTHLYVSSRTGEVVLDTGARERAWNWAGSVVHWLYFTALRANQPLWRQVVLWVSAVGIVVALSGVWLGIARLRWRGRIAGQPATPYRGWMAWHHVGGLVGGVLVLTWIFSGWLSMGPPVPWTSASPPGGGSDPRVAYAGNVEPRFGMTLPRLQDLDAYPARQARFMWLAGRPQVVLANSVEAGSTVIDATSGRPRALTDQELFAAARHLVPDGRPVSMQRLEQEDAYWYTHHTPRKLPVLRAMFDDPARTWIYIDPETGDVLARIDRGRRIHRWLFNGLHRLDFRWLRHNRPAWDIALWSLSAAGLVVSLSGVVIGWRRLRRSLPT